MQQMLCNARCGTLVESSAVKKCGNETIMFRSRRGADKRKKYGDSL